MPRVPTLDEFQANAPITQPVQVGQASVANVPNFAPQQGADMGRALMQAGNQVAQIAMQRQTDINDAATKEADNIAAQNVSKLLNNPEGGFLTLKGKSAVDAREGVRNAVQESLNSAGEGLTNDMQRQMYRQVAQRRMQMALQQIDTHAGQQTRVWNETETTARISNAGDGMVSNWYSWNQPAGPNNAFTTSRDTMIAETRALGALKGFGPDSETTKAAVMAQLTKAHQGVIASMVAGEKVTEANEYFKRNYNDIDPIERAKLEANLRKAEGAIVASQTADEIWTSAGPKNQGDAIDLFKMEAAARQKFANEPEKAKSTIEELRQRATAWDKSEAEFITSNKNAVGQLVMSGKSMKEVMLSQAFLALPGAEQQQVRDQLTDRAFAMNQRSRTLRLQAEEDQARKNAPAFFELSDPRKLQTMTRAEVESQWTKIGIANTNSLLTKWDALQGKVEGATILQTDDLIKGSATKMGILPSTGKPNGDQALGFFNYQRTIAEKVTAFEAADLQGRRKASPEEVRRIVQQVELDKVYTDNFGPDKQKPVAQLTPDQMVNAYVKVGQEEIQLSQIPSTQRALIIQALRTAGKPVNEQNIADYWVRGGKKK